MSLGVILIIVLGGIIIIGGPIIAEIASKAAHRAELESKAGNAELSKNTDKKAGK